MRADNAGLDAVDLGSITLLQVLEPAGGASPHSKPLSFTPARRHAVVNPAPNHGTRAAGAKIPPPPLEEKAHDPCCRRTPRDQPTRGVPPLPHRRQDLEPPRGLGHVHDWPPDPRRHATAGQEEFQKVQPDGVVRLGQVDAHCKHGFVFHKGPLQVCRQQGAVVLGRPTGISQPFHAVGRQPSRHCVAPPPGP